MSRAIGINFHGIGTPGRALEQDEAPYWLERDRFLDVLDRITAVPDPGAYVITFDDGNLSDHEIALPALAERGLGAAFFVLSGRIGQAGSLDAGHIRALQAAGMTIGSHGCDHRAWATLDAVALEAELTESKAVLEEICDREVDAAGIPFGNYDSRVLRALRRAGYRTAYSSDCGTMAPGAFLRPRTSLRNDMGAAEIEAILTGRLTPLRRLRRALGMARRRWLPLGG